MIHGLLIVLMLLVWLPCSAMAATRLGLHVTQEELNCWKQRAGVVANNSLTPNCSNADTMNGFTFQNIYNSRILADADTFRVASHPGADGHWEGWTGAGCNPTNPPHQTTPSASAPGNNNGLQMFKSAFVFMLTGDVNYATPVRTELLEQIAEVGTNFANTAKWCPYPALWDIIAFLTVPWASRVLHSYDYLIAGGYTGFSAGEKAAIETWLLNAALFFDTITVGTIQANCMPDAFDNPANFACTGSCLGGDSQYPNIGIYFGGPAPVEPHMFFTNRWSAAWAFGTEVGILVNHSELIRHGRVAFEGTLRFGTYSDGSHYDFIRWRDCACPTNIGTCGPVCPGGTNCGVGQCPATCDACPRSGWAHAAPMLGALITTADVIARKTGDTSLYTLASSGGLRGSDGGSLTLLTVTRRWARLVNGTEVAYATELASENGNANYKFTWNENAADTTSHSYMDQIMAQANLFYQNSEITTAVNRTKEGTVTACSDSNNGCFNSAYVSYPDVPFMFGKMAGVVDPFSLTSDTTPPAAPTNLHVVTP
jgi:hypothetical protein